MSELYKIDKNIEIPPLPKKGGRKRIYPLTTMEIGDSFFVECKKEKLTKVQCNLGASFRKNRMKGKKFITRSVKGGVRCWRIE